MTKKLYYEDSYLKSTPAEVIAVDAEKGIKLNATVLFPKSSTEMGDYGFINDSSVTTTKYDDEIWHEFKNKDDVSKFSVGDQVICSLDWERRKSLLRRHSALHLVAHIIGDMGKVPAGGQVHDDEAYLIMREIIPEEIIPQAVDKANNIIQEKRLMQTYEDAERVGFRYSHIEGFPPLPCGGIHVKSLDFIGKIIIQEVKTRKKKTYVYINVE